MIAAEHLTKRYGRKTALSDLSFSIEKGEIVGLLGLNGAGKTTTMNILTGYIAPSSGRASVDGFDIVAQPKEAKRLIGYLPESLAFYAEMKVREYLRFICGLKGIKDNRERHIDAVCGMVGIESMAGRMIRNLSKGYRQRVGLAQSIIGDPKVLILDEPTVGLDPSQIIEIRGLIKKIGKNSTVIVSSHILSEIEAICSRVIVLRNGKLAADASPAELAGAARGGGALTVRVRGRAADIEAAFEALAAADITKLGSREPDSWDYAIRSPNGTDVRADVTRILAGANLPLLSLQSDDRSLEEVFLELVGRPEEQNAKPGKGGKRR